MRGIPRLIQTRADLQNLFAMAQAGELDKGEVANRVRALLNRQYHSVPIISAEGALVKTMYFPEVNKGDTTDDELTVKNVVHIEDPEHEGEGKQYSETHITLSKAPANATVLSIYMEDNFLTQNDFDVAEINYILGVLENA